MGKTLVIHGRQPALGRAELESLFKARALKPIGNIATSIDIPPADINFGHLGGMVKFCKILTVLNTVEWDVIEKFLLDTMPGHANDLEGGKLTIGLSSYGLKTTPKRLLATGLELKKAIKKSSGRSVRLVPNKTTDLNAAQVLYNKLTSSLGWELVFVRNKDQTVVAQSIAVQDIEKYAARDQERPFRDARIGMLPPKLAQVVINLTGAKPGDYICDPFCGTGVLLQEAILMGINVLGSDINPRMVEYSRKNLEWLAKTSKNIFPGGIKPSSDYVVELADATTRKFSVSHIACETYLGQPLSTFPEPKKIQQIVTECDEIHKKFLRNVAKQTNTGFRLCLAVPAWKTKNGFRHLETLDKLSELGYNRLKLVHVSNNELIYHRPGQIVARELVVLERK